MACSGVLSISTARSSGSHKQGQKVQQALESPSLIQESPGESLATGTGQKLLPARRGRGDRAITMVCHLLTPCNIHDGSFHLPVDGWQHPDNLREELLILHMLQNGGLELFDVTVIRAIDSN